MASELRKTGISVVGDVPWGTHFCYFYETKQDLLDILIPYFKAGLESKEFCLWVISNSELLTVEEATSALRNSLPDVDRYVAEKSIEVFGHADWFLNGDTFDPHRVANRFKEKLDEALARGYPGMRVNGSPAWLHDEGQKELRKFEADLHKLFPTERVIASCTYPLGSIRADEIFDVVQTHQFAIARRQGQWELLETPELIQAKAEIKRLNEELEQRVIEQTKELAETNEELTREIFERLDAEVALRKQNEILQKIFDNIPVMINFTDSDGRVKLVNREWQKTLGWSLEEIRNEDLDVFAECYPDPESRQKVMEFVKRATGEWADFRSRIKDGKVIDTSWARVRLSDDTTIGIGQDITERKRIEEQLRQSESQLAEAQRLASVGSWNWDIQNNTHTWSSELYHMYGLHPQESDPSYETFMELVHPDDRAAIDEAIDRGLKTQEPINFHLRIIRSDGTERIIHSRGNTITDLSGTPIRMHGTVQDVTERKQAEDALREAERKYRDMFENAGEGIFQSTPDGRYIAANPALAQIHGFASPEELIHSRQDISRQVYVDPTRREEFKRLLEEEGALRGFEHQVFRKDWSKIWISVNARTVRDEQGAIQYYEGTAQDITDRKRAEQRLQITSEQLRALSARFQSAREEEGARIAREIHDELGSVLTSLKWDLEGTERILGSPMEPSQLAALRERLPALMKLTDLAISSIRRIASELRPSVLDDLGLAAAIEWQAQQFQARTGIICRCDCSLENLDLSREQSTAVFRIFQEALTNILRHAQATSIDITMKVEAGEFVLVIIDNGRGITENEKSRLQSLGLLGMQERAYLIGGKINISGVEGKGTEINVRVPISG